MSQNIQAPASREIISTNPATGQEVGRVPVFSQEQVSVAIAKARAAQPAWNRLGFKQRAKYILAARDWLLDHTDEVAALISEENGKPVVEAIGNDIMPVMDLMTYFAKKSESLLKKERLKLGKWTVLGRASHLEFYPYGVVGVIAPWNFPLSIPLGEVTMALLVGNTVVLKPSEHTPMVGEKIKEIFKAVSLPEGVLQVISGDGMTGAALVSGGCDKIAFTGSVGTGKKIMEACSHDLTPCTLELGGKDPLIVFEDADLDVASSAAVWGAFCNSGQVCASVERVYVQESVFENFKERVVQKTKLLKQGVGSDPDVELGAMTAEMQINKVAQQVDDARARGAQILTGGERIKTTKGIFYPPTVITGVDHSFDVVKEETFGPVLPLMSFKNDEEVITLANDSAYGLNAYVWSKNASRARRVASQLVAGTVNINESLFTHALPQTPWGGPKLSGIGRTHGALGLLDLVQVRHVHENKQPAKRNFFWWYDYNATKISMMKDLNVALFGKGTKRAKAFLRFVKASLKAKVN
ncbi:MAG: aldehyde dehydrogenase family protein [Deltaproteobacteria bacterium]|nr:aldehyde dehydrogenase family protein [Deltaproteobacteria bacterium]